MKNINELPALLEFLLEDDSTLLASQSEITSKWDSEKLRRYGSCPNRILALKTH